MLETFIAILIALGLNFGYTEKGELSVTESTMVAAQSSEMYKSKIGSSKPEGIVVLPDVDPEAKDIVVLPDVDPKEGW